MTNDDYFFLGCSHGTAALAPAAGWTHISFGNCATQWFSATLGNFACPSSGSTVVGIAIIFDEGNDTAVGGGIITPGRTVIDNIFVNDTIVGKPGAGPKS